LAYLDGVKEWIVVDVVIVVQIHRLFDRAAIDASQTADGLQEVPVGARIILSPDRKAFLPTVGGEAVVTEGTPAPEGRIHQPGEHELGRPLPVGGKREIVVFDSGILAKRPLKSMQAPEEHQYACGRYPRLARHHHS
jgi:hypothetical protein